MLDARDIEYRYREYTQEPLSEAEIREVLGLLGSAPREVLRKRDANAKGLTGDETDDELIGLMARHPTLLQRPIGVLEGRAVLGRPPERLLELVD